VIFSPELTFKVLSGSKVVTRRRVSHRDSDGKLMPYYKCGGTYAIQPGRGKPHIGHILVERVDLAPLGWMNVVQAENEGFSEPAEFVTYWQKIHGHYDAAEVVAVIRFKLAGRCPSCR